MSTPYAPDGAAYAEAVEALLDLANRHPGTSGAHAAAEVLLSCYNGHDFHLAPHESASSASGTRSCQMATGASARSARNTTTSFMSSARYKA